MLPDQMKNLLIGIFTATAITIIIFMIMFLHPSVGDQGQILRIRFTDIDKINVGTRVLFAGKPVGEVTEIKLLDEVRKERIERGGDVYVYELTMAVDTGLKVYNTDRISLRTSGLLGEKSVSIDPEPPKKGQEIRIVNGEILYAEGAGSVEDAFKDFKEVANKLDVVLDLVTDTFQELKDRNTWENIASAVENISEITSKLSDSWKHVDESITNIAETSANAREITDKVVAGKGTAGKIFSNDDLYLNTIAILNKGETVMDDVNHYGILFHNDKRWQRLRARRMNLMEKLKTPQEFRNFFNQEVDQVSTSLARVNMVLEKAGKYPYCVQDHEFRKVYTELLRRVSSLEDSLEMYNTQIIEPDVQKTELVR